MHTAESHWLYRNADAAANSSESDVLLYVDASGATGPVRLHYDLRLRGTPGKDTLYVEYTSTRVPLAQGVVYFEDGDESAVINLSILGDDVKEAIEQGRLVLINGSTGVTVDLTRDTANIAVKNDDDEVSIDDAVQSKPEGTGGETFIEFTLTRNAPGIEKVVAWEIDFANLGNGLTAAQVDDFFDGVLTGTATFAEV